MIKYFDFYIAVVLKVENSRLSHFLEYNSSHQYEMSYLIERTGKEIYEVNLIVGWDTGVTMRPVHYIREKFPKAFKTRK